MEIPPGFRQHLWPGLLGDGGPSWCRVCAHNIVLHNLSEQPWKCYRPGCECPGLETAELDALIQEWLTRTLQRCRPGIPLGVRRAVLERDGMICRYCGRKVHRRKTGPGKLHFDHVIPHCRGGRPTVENIVVSCRTCNLRKSAADAEEWLASCNRGRAGQYDGLQMAPGNS
jgi:HNH endonuclease